MENRDDYSKDMLLAGFVASAQNKQLQTTLTVSVSGVFYSGVIGTPTDFWEFRQALSGESTGEKTDFELKSNTEKIDPAQIDFIHLKDCQALIPGSPLLPTNKMVIRIKLSAVDAWTWGELHPG